MDWQLMVIFLMAAAAACYLGRSLWRAFQGGKSGCGPCGCGTKGGARSKPQSQATLVSTDELTARLREPGRGKF